MTDETKPTIDKKEEAKKTEKLATPKSQEAPKPEPSKKEEPKKEAPKDSTATKPTTPSEAKPSDSKPKEPAKPKPQTPKIKKTEATVKGTSLPISTKKSSGICRFIKGKTIDNAISDLELVLQKRKAVPIKGEIAHKKSVKKIASGSGSYPKKASEQFIKLLNSLKANADANGLDEPIIVEAFANIAQRPFARFGRWKRKRTHIKIVVKDKKKLKKTKQKKKEKEK